MSELTRPDNPIENRFCALPLDDFERLLPQLQHVSFSGVR